MDAALILADQILQLIRAAGASQQEGYAALSVASSVLKTLEDIPFTHDAPEAVREVS